MSVLQVPSAVQSGVGISTGQEALLQGYMMDNAAAARAAPAAQACMEEVRSGKEQDFSSGDNTGLKGPGAKPAAAMQANHVAQPDKSGFGTPTASAPQQVHCYQASLAALPRRKTRN